MGFSIILWRADKVFVMYFLSWHSAVVQHVLLGFFMLQESTYAYFCAYAMKFVAMEISKPVYD